MCGRRFVSMFLLFALALSSVGAQSTPSPKETIIDSLVSYQVTLSRVKSSIEDSKRNIELLSKQIEMLKQQLEDSKTGSQEIIDDLKRQLALSEERSLRFQADLVLQQENYKTLSKDFEKLSRSYEFYRNATKILAVTVAVFVGKEIGHGLKIW